MTKSKLISLVVLISVLLSWEYFFAYQAAAGQVWYLQLLLIVIGPLAWLLTLVGASLLAANKPLGLNLLITSGTILTVGAGMFGTTFSFIPFVPNLFPFSTGTPLLIAAVNLGVVIGLMYFVRKESRVAV